MSASAAGERGGATIGTVAQHAVNDLRRALVSGELAPGDRIGQEQIATSLGISLAPVREALATLEQEGQVTYRPRRGYFVTELDLGDVREIYELRALLEDRAALRAVTVLDEDAIDRIELAARECVDAAAEGDIAAALEANRRFHFGVLSSPDQQHTLRLIRLLWDSTETYRALYYNARQARQESTRAHDQIVAAIQARDGERLVAELDAHRQLALGRMTAILASGERRR